MKKYIYRYIFRLELKSRQGVPGGGRHSRTLTGEAGRAPLERSATKI